MHCRQQCQEYCKKQLGANALFSSMLNSDELFDQVHQHLPLFGYKIQKFQVFHFVQFHWFDEGLTKEALTFLFLEPESIVTEYLKANKVELISQFPFVVSAIGKCLRLGITVPTDVNLTLKRCSKNVKYL